jgi:HEAT repeat protein
VSERDDLLARTRAGETASRAAALRALRRWNDPEVQEALARALEEPVREIQEAAADTLLEVGDAGAVRRLMPRLRSDTPSVRNWARLVLERLARAEPAALDELSRDPDERMRIFAANIMAGTGDQDRAPRLLELLEDASVNVRDAAIVALGRLAAPEAAPALAALAGREEPWVRFSAVDALSKIPGAEAGRALAGLLESGAGGDLAEPLVDALAQQGSRDAADALLRALERGTPAVRRAAARAAGRLRLEAARALLERLAEGAEPSLAAEARASLAAFGAGRKERA